MSMSARSGIEAGIMMTLMGCVVVMMSEVGVICEVVLGGAGVTKMCELLMAL